MTDAGVPDIGCHHGTPCLTLRDLLSTHARSCCVSGGLLVKWCTNELLTVSQTITVGLYSQQLERVHKALMHKEPAFVNRKGELLHENIPRWERMVFMIKLPPALVMSPPADPRGKDDRISLLKSLHRPYGHMDNGSQTYGQEAPVQQQFSHQQHQRNSAFSQIEPHKVFCLRQQFLMAAAIIVVSSLVVFVLFITTFRKVPNDDSFLKLNSILGTQELSSSRGEVAVKTSCGHVIGKSEDGSYVFKGIAYAKPPVGPLRWRKPVPLWVDTWCDEHQTQEAFHFGSKCFQLNPYSKHYEGNEDCLFLNVWTPSLDSSVSS
ncbi:uncharacterized protein LOC118197679 [Stegodyphus dumicola]|uniref:uncharacterized protein LOC118197679 n=1 Tax=Stegodyphus dumicola TaxID=202533 RepID=UPI0015AFEDEF|nr:uncharacterized protein LOC118197679 [Stegodyphus dumicola]